jgi:uncharacterized BrkB/YihY/UPF0761 family membrane protein
VSYEPWEPWSSRQNYVAPPHQRTRIVREVRIRDFVIALIVLVVLTMFALATAADGFHVWVDVLQKGSKSRFGIQQVNYATAKLLLGPAFSVVFLWLIWRVVRNGWWCMTTPPDTIYIRRRW